MIGFRAYILARRITDTPNGDFVADARRDRRLPDAASWHQLAAHLVHQHAYREVFAAARAVWAQYVRYAKRHQAGPAAPAQEEPAR